MRPAGKGHTALFDYGDGGLFTVLKTGERWVC